MREEQLFSWRSLKASTGAPGLTAASEQSVFIYFSEFRWNKCLAKLLKLGDKKPEILRNCPFFRYPYLPWSIQSKVYHFRIEIKILVSFFCYENDECPHTFFQCLCSVSLIKKEAVRRRKIQVLHEKPSLIFSPFKMHFVQLSRIIFNLQIQNKRRLNTVLQVWCSKGSLWKVRFIFEITNIGICAGVLVVVRPVVSILSLPHSSQFCPVLAICEE